MSDKEKGRVEHEATDPSDEAAASKLWAVYISEAEKYDKSLVESWKSDMEGMLIFAGLFYASLTAFLIESYKTLSPDSGDQTVKLLAHISHQLASGFNGTTSPISPSAPFTPSSTSLICNALWFISLGLSLTCALIATLLEQWARDFTHRADMRSAPLMQARIYSYLYYGMKRFNMHVVVDVIPLLLHASLFLFFAGLVAFLIPVNIIMAAITAILLFLVTAAYSILTFLSLRYMDCPHRTPLSGAFWPLFQRLRSIWTRRFPPVDPPAAEADPETTVEVMARRAIEDSPARKERDHNALVWTVKSLADDIELEPFVAALPDALWGRTGPRKTYYDHIRRLANSRDVQLTSRIDALYAATKEGILSPGANSRRQIACYKALWAIASPARRMPSQTLDCDLPVDFSGLHLYSWNGQSRWQEEIHTYGILVQTAMEWSTFCAVDVGLEEHEQYLVHCQTGSPQYCKPPQRPTTSFLQAVTRRCGFSKDGDKPYWWSVQTNSAEPVIPTQSTDQLELIRSLRKHCAVKPS
ncbi:hypothetical protein DFH06DRAFT_1087982 [Mycena polygramma]|nr:hypothetical protein DFH06DRAFT_1087982 [Mycena polygramma]